MPFMKKSEKPHVNPRATAAAETPGVHSMVYEQVREANVQPNGRISSFPGERLIDAYRIMYSARKSDEKILTLLRQGKVLFHIGTSGHEAAQVATAFAMQSGKDWAYPYYRDMAFSLAFGYTIEEIFLEALHRANGPSSGGFAMPFNYGHREHRIISQSSPTGTQY